MFVICGREKHKDTNSINHNRENKSDVVHEIIETNFQTDMEGKSPKMADHNPSKNLTTHLTQKSNSYEITSNTTMNKDDRSDSSTPFVNMSLDLSKESIRWPDAKLSPQNVTRHEGSKKNAHIRIRRQVFLCSACGTYYEKWNLFYHIREAHNKFICLFENCLGIFPNAERLVSHLESKHVHKPFVYEHKDDLLRSLRNKCFLMCCVCEHIFSESDDVTAHSCETFMKPCTVCGLTFIHKSNCSALLSKHKQKRTAVTPNKIQQLTKLMPNTTISNNVNFNSQQTFLRNALLGQEPRPNNYQSDYQNSPSIAQIPIFDHRLYNIPPHHVQSQTQTQTHAPRQPVPVSIPIMNGSVSQQSLVRFIKSTI